ncbi:30S ribosomal protein S16, partial [Candidatus Sulcia muelleri str. Hc (Homalodisca coagulata)]
MKKKIRQKRKGRKKKAFNTIVVSNSRSPRKGKLKEKSGFNNPNTNQNTKTMKDEKADNGKKKGEQP